MTTGTAVNHSGRRKGRSPMMDLHRREAAIGPNMQSRIAPFLLIEGGFYAALPTPDEHLSAYPVFRFDRHLLGLNEPPCTSRCYFLHRDRAAERWARSDVARAKKDFRRR